MTHAENSVIFEEPEYRYDGSMKTFFFAQIWLKLSLWERNSVLPCVRVCVCVCVICHVWNFKLQLFYYFVRIKFYVRQKNPKQTNFQELMYIIQHIPNFWNRSFQQNRRPFCLQLVRYPLLKSLCATFLLIKERKWIKKS